MAQQGLIKLNYRRTYNVYTQNQAYSGNNVYTQNQAYSGNESITLEYTP